MVAQCSRDDTITEITEIANRKKKDDYNDKESATPCFVRPCNDFYTLCAGKQKLQVQTQIQIQTIKYKISVFGRT